MTPFFLITTPRSRGTLLMRMLDATVGVRCVGESTGLLAMLRKLEAEPDGVWRRHGESEPWPMHRQHVDLSIWRERVRALLPGWINPRPGETHYGMRSSFLGREGWERAVDEWSWLLETWPEARIVFLGREQGEIELSMMMTSDLWRPHYGNCPGVCGGRVYHHLLSMQDFHRLNPERTVCIDAAELADYAGLREKLGRVGIPLDAVAHTAELAVVSGSREQLRKREPAVPQVKPKPALDIFDPSVTYQQAVVMLHPPKLEVHTLRWGNPPWMAPCSAAMQAWCDLHGYPLQVHGPDAGEEVGKFSTLTILRDFLSGKAELMLFLDADVMIHQGAPAWPGGSGFRARPDLPGKAIEDWHEWLAEHQPDLDAEAWTYCNSGVWSCDRASAEKFLAVAEGRPRIPGYQEQHQFNLWWREAAGEGMEFGHLPGEWNVIASLEEKTAGYLIHLAGKKKEAMLKRFHKGEWPLWKSEEERLAEFKADPFGDLSLRAGLDAWKPLKPWAFKRKDALHERAIICPWLSREAAWGEEELMRAMRSWHLHFTDRDCPIYILGDRPPKWLREGGRMRFIRIDYSRGREVGLRDAYATGLQLAREVILTNDDFYLLKETGWEDLRVAMRVGRLDLDVKARLESPDGWQRTLGSVCRDLQKAGKTGPIYNFATHTPFLYERGKAVEVLERFHLRYRGSFENLYHNWHATPSRRCGRLRTTRLPAPEARFLYHHDKTLTPELKAAIMAAFPDPAPWEKVAEPAPAIPRKIHQTWKDRKIPREVYPEEWTSSWKRHHPAWEYKLWTDRDLLDLARKDYPEFAELLATARGVVRGDVGRLLVLHRHGGLYADLDYLALAPLDPLIGSAGFHYCELPGWASNALMACAPGDPLPLAMAHEALKRWQRRPSGKVEWIGGPDLLGEMARQHPVIRWRPADVCPLDWRKREHEAGVVPASASAVAVTFWRHHW